jgi:hypothetical protein
MWRKEALVDERGEEVHREQSGTTELQHYEYDGMPEAQWFQGVQSISSYSSNQHCKVSNISSFSKNQPVKS